MSADLLIVVAVATVLAAAGVVAWTWLAMARVEAELRDFCHFEGIHFDQRKP